MKRLRTGLRWLADRRSYRAALNALADSNAPDAPQLTASLRRAWSGELSAEEADWIERIEALRERVDGSTAIIRTTGPEWSGDPADPRVAEIELGQLSRTASKRPLSARALFVLVREFGPSTCLELGSCVGISAAYQAAALRLNGRGELVSLEASRERIAAAERHLEELGLDNVTLISGRFQETLEPTLRSLTTGVDYAFIDGHHDERATLAYFEGILPFVAPRAMLVFDDIHWSDGMERAWTELQAHQAVSLAVDLRDMGIAILKEIP